MDSDFSHREWIRFLPVQVTIPIAASKQTKLWVEISTSPFITELPLTLTQSINIFSAPISHSFRGYVSLISLSWRIKDWECRVSRTKSSYGCREVEFELLFAGFSSSRFFKPTPCPLHASSFFKCLFLSRSNCGKRRSVLVERVFLFARQIGLSVPIKCFLPLNGRSANVKQRISTRFYMEKETLYRLIPIT